MRITIPKATLLRELAVISDVVEKKLTIPILGNALITATDAGVTLAATNLRESLVVTGCAAEVDRRGQIAAPVQRLSAFVRVLPDGELTLDAANSTHVRVASGRTHADFPLLPPEDFPAVPLMQASTRAVAVKTLRQMIRETRYGVSTEAVRHYAPGGLFDWSGKNLRIVATDGYVVAIAERPAEPAPEDGINCIVPRLAWAALDKMLAEVDGEAVVEVARDVNRIWFSVGGREMSAILVDGTYAAWQRIVPKHSGNWVDIPREPLRQALRRVEVVSTRDNQMARLSTSSHQLQCTAETPDGSVDDAFAVDVHGADIQAYINPRFIVSFIESVDTDAVRLHWRDELSPTLWEPLGAEGTRCVIAQMRPPEQKGAAA